MELLRKLRGFLSNPKTKLWWATHNFGRIPLLIRQRRPGALIGYVVAGATGISVYGYYIRFLISRSGEVIERMIRGNPMKLNLRDDGLSRDLFIYGVREERGTELFERELERVAETVDEGVVIEIGANIGYFALMELNALGDSPSLVAFEPDERSAALLERNLDLNGYRDAATVERAAVGSECGTAEFELLEHSNLNKVKDELTVDPEYEVDRTVTVDMWSIDSYLDVHDIDPESVVAARMDVEGYEVEVLRGMDRVLSAPGPLVLSLEIHPGRLRSSDIRDLGKRLDNSGFEVVEALTESITVYPFVDANVRDVDSVRSLPHEGPAYNIILRKPAPTRTQSSQQIDSTEQLAKGCRQLGR